MDRHLKLISKMGYKDLKRYQPVCSDLSLEG